MEKTSISSQEILISRLEAYRLRYGLNYRELAAKLNIPYTTLAEIVHRKRTPRLDTIDMIAGAMKLPAYELLMPDAEMMEDMEEQEYKDVLVSNVWKLSRRKRKMLSDYLRMLQECSFIP